jgi:S1-C subfamily serine protease
VKRLIKVAFRPKIHRADIIFALIFVIGFGLVSYSTLGGSPATKESLTETSVKIVRGDRRSGGSGVILSSTADGSTILTNAHVCGIIKKGGIVLRDGEEHAITTYAQSTFHDLCLVTVAADLGTKTKIARRAPHINALATVIGHPSLLPTVVTEGRFSGREIIEVMTDLRPCTQADIDANPEKGIMCLILGGIPTLTRYEAQLVTAFISPGSSGSPVFNERGELSGLVFAGSGPVSNAFIVPLESVRAFIYEEPKDIRAPNNSFELTLPSANAPESAEATLSERLDALCATPQSKIGKDLRHICEIHEKDVLWRP